MLRWVLARVDPYTVRIPTKLTNQDGTLTPEAIAWFNYDNMFKHQLRERTGGGSDNIEGLLDISIANETAISNVYAQAAENEKELNNAHFNEQSVFIEQQLSTKTKTSNYVALDFDYINAKSNIEITFPQYPNSNSVIIIRNGDGSLIRLNGNGKKINGFDTGNIRQKDTSIRFYYFADSAEWFAG